MEKKEEIASLADLRKQIDEADRTLLEAFVKRMRICSQVAEHKKKNGIEVYDAAREKEKTEEIRRISPDDMEEYCVMLYNKIMELSRDFQEDIISR